MFNIGTANDLTCGFCKKSCNDTECGGALQKKKKHKQASQ